VIEMEVRQDDMELVDPVEQTRVSDESTSSAADVEKQCVIAVPHQDAARFTRTGRSTAAAAENRHIHHHQE
jgi:hypothetical protein